MGFSKQSAQVLSSLIMVLLLSSEDKKTKKEQPYRNVYGCSFFVYFDHIDELLPI